MELQITETHIEQLKEWVVEAGALALANQQNVVERFKADNTPATNVDDLVELFLVEKVREAFPDHQIIAEESGRVGPDSDWLWALDPIDGTKSFMCKLPVWAVSVGLMHRDVPVMGAVYLPTSQDLFWGGPGGSRWNGDRLQADSKIPYDHELLFLAVHSHAHEDNEILYPRIQAYGSTAAHLAFLAAGQAVGVLARRVHIWDLAGVLPILTQAGYGAEYLSGHPVDLNKLADGRKTSEQMIATRLAWMNQLRGDVRLR